MSTVKPIPEGYHTVTPYLIIRDAASAIDFYKKAFNATELMRMPGPDGKIGHAEIRIGDSPIMMADESVSMNAKSPQTLGGSPCFIMLYVENVDTLFAQAIAAGGTVLRPVENQFYGDRMGMLTDPFGYQWGLGTHIEDVAPDELARRAAAMGKKG
jgi:PhnB protein